ncbi:MAG: ABC transporter permease [Lachnospiraceae bacterium]|nr:ABC transporter permease [Lachnospiraceae bacterium]
MKRTMRSEKYDESLEKSIRELQREQRHLRLLKLKKNKLAIIGGLITIFMILIAIFAPLIATHDPYDMIVLDRLKGPSAAHLFGTDATGRDVFSRVLYGTRVSMFIGFSVALYSMIIGMVVGLFASYYKVLDSVLMRICDGLTAIPSSLLAVALMSALGASEKNVIISLVAVSFPKVARIARAQAMVVKEQTYIEAMKASGSGTLRILFRHIAPNVLSPVIVQVSFAFANAIITEAALSFLGVGVPIPQPSWGNILYEGKEVISKAWWMIVFPGAFTAAAVLGLNILGDGLRDLLDPHIN